jgi:pimeloyl-ACP methyl ester carboxylesterase
VLRYRTVAAAAPRHCLLYVHGIESHGAWFLPAAHLLRAHGCTTYLPDRRGSGLNCETAPGDAPSASVLLEDLRCFRRHLGDPEIHLVGLSWGGKLATAAALDAPRGLKSLILVTPGLKSLIDLPLARKVALLLGLAAGGRNRIRLPIEAEMFSRTRLYIDFIRNDPWRLRAVTGRFLLASAFLGRLIARRLRALQAPILLFLAGQDRIIDNDGVLDLLSVLPPARTRLRVFGAATHSLQFDELDSLVAEMGAFLEGKEATA